MLEKQKLFAVLEASSFSGKPAKKSDAIDAITSSLVIVSYLLSSFEAAENYYAMAEGWSILAACMARYAARHAIPADYWCQSLDLVMAELEANLALLRKDAIGRQDFLEGDWRADGGVMLRVRTMIVLGALACHEVLPVGSWKTDRSRDEVLQLIRKHIDRRNVWGDSGFPYLFFIIRFLEARNETGLAEKLLDEIFVALTEANFRQQGPVFPSPYLGIEEILASQIPDRLQDVDLDVYRGSSYIIRPVLEMLVRRGRRDLVAAKWRRFTYCEQHEFVPDRPEDIFAWRIEDGTNASGFPNKTQSWAALVAESQDMSAVPAVYRDFRQVLPFHILVCPHRATPSVIRLLDVP